MFEKKSLVRQHLSEVHYLCRKSFYGKARDHQCCNCKVMFETEEAMNMHVCRVTPKEKGLKMCKICNIKFPKRNNLVLHNLHFHTKEKPFACDLCDFKTKIVKSLTLHKRRIHEQVKDEVCPFCGLELRDKYGLQCHIQSIHSSGEKKFVCDKCGASYATKQSLKYHQNEKHRTFSFCGLCDKIFPTTHNSRALRMHLSNDHQIDCGLEDYYICWMCHKGYTCVKELDDHLIMLHDMPKDEEGCQICNTKPFATKTTLKMHVLESHNIDFSKASNPPFINKLFDILREYNSQTETSDSVPCPICHKRFKYERTMVDHRRQVHEKESHVKCDKCDYSTYQPHMMKRHMAQVHTDARMFTCDQCPYTAKRITELRVHKRRIHENFRKFQCSHCDKGYNAKGQYAKHLLTNHNVVYQYNA